MSQGGYTPIDLDCYKRLGTISVSEYFLKESGINVPEEWLTPCERMPKGYTGKELKLTNFPEHTKTQYHDWFYSQYLKIPIDELPK